MHRLGGELRVRSDLGVGTCFFFELHLQSVRQSSNAINFTEGENVPILVPESSQLLALRSRGNHIDDHVAEESKHRSPIPKTYEVLLVDDSSMNLYVLDSLLKFKLGITCESFLSGDLLLRHLRNIL